MQTQKLKQVLIFDFDGLIVDTESISVEQFRKNFSKVGLVFDLDAYLKLIGTASEGKYNPWKIYADHTGDQRNLEEIREQYNQEMHEVVEQSAPMEGVIELIDQAKSHGILLAVGSSSNKAWVYPKLKHFGIFDKFDTIVTCDDVSRAKPSPEIFLTVLERLQVKPENALVLEDSKNGCLASKNAGIRVVLVPNEITRLENNPYADDELSSLKQINLSNYFVL
jgi:putative hydrolase of the HAD superfamily